MQNTDANALTIKAAFSLFCLTSALLLCLLPASVHAQEAGAQEEKRTAYTAPDTKDEKTEAEDVQQVLIHPVIDVQQMTCTNHAVGERLVLGDAYGKDCMAVDQAEASRRTAPGLHHGKGLENEDYHAWKKPVLAPFDGVVASVDTPSISNPPGKMLEESQTGRIEFERSRDGVHVVYAHVRDIRLAVGDSVSAGQTVARVGNNGNSGMPHVHIGAWKGKTPFQIRFDLKALGCVRGDVSESECD